MIHRFCISHKKPLLPESWYDDCIALGDFQTDSELHVRQLDQFWHEARPIAYGAAGSYVLPIAVERFAGGAKLIEISTYRKRILPSVEGIKCKSYPTMREWSLGNSGKEAELAVFTPRADLEFLLAPPIHFKYSMLEQYAILHRRRDILDYTSLAIELGVLDYNSASEFLAANSLIPGGVECGIYPKSWLIDALSKIELVGRQFLCRYGDRLRSYDEYQIRAVGFLSERLGSFLLMRHLTEKYSDDIPADIFGYMTVIVEGNSSYSSGLTNRRRAQIALRIALTEMKTWPSNWSSWYHNRAQ